MALFFSFPLASLAPGHFLFVLGVPFLSVEVGRQIFFIPYIETLKVFSISLIILIIQEWVEWMQMPTILVPFYFKLHWLCSDYLLSIDQSLDAIYLSTYLFNSPVGVPTLVYWQRAYWILIAQGR